VIATTSSEKKAERLIELGASDVINYVSTPDWRTEVRRLTNDQRADVIVEVGGAGTIAQSIAGLRTAASSRWSATSLTTRRAGISWTSPTAAPRSARSAAAAGATWKT